MGELPSWMNHADVADAKEAMAKLSPEDQHALLSVTGAAIVFTHKDLLSNVTVTLLKILKPEAADAIEALRDTE